MAIAEELIAGVVSSVLAVLLVEIYLAVRRRYRKRALRWLIGTETASVVTPVYPWAGQGHPSGLLTTYDAIGLAHVLEACNRLGTVPVITRSGESTENSPLDVIAIGGPSGNQVSATFLKAYCPGFEVLTDPDTGRLSYRCGGRTFDRTDDETFAFIARLSPRDTGLPGTALIVWGHSAVATAAAGYFVARYPDVLRKVGKGSFFVAISVRYVLGYRSFDTRPIDLTDAAFAAPLAPKPVSAPPARSEDSSEDEPRPRRFGRARRAASSPAERVPVPVSGAGTTVVGGRSRVAQALDDVRASTPSSASSVADAPAPVGSSASSARGSASVEAVTEPRAAVTRPTAASAPVPAEGTPTTIEPTSEQQPSDGEDPEPEAKPTRRGRSSK
ncbi:hypothetical protein [Cryptosporangium phraense]|uniref:Uncharacterized protein n=1 Tax=Cryptosporangium phraense TaxID=2593070 RepID=A0A545AGE7_9ACTN|nr:hypothetical protein [Cryptosporangium phraense]TQS40399.1 hypothetical protein FL583_35300 [Cryptosporangium phraense]